MIGNLVKLLSLFILLFYSSCGFNHNTPTQQIQSIVTVFSASGDFGPMQPFRGWSARYRSGTQEVDMIWITDASQPGGGYWRGNEQYLIVARDQVHPGETATGASIRQWTASEVGSIQISGIVKDINPSCGDGVEVSILRDGLPLWKNNIANGDTSGKAYYLLTTVMPGTKISFIVEKREDSGCDATYFDPTVTHTSGSDIVFLASADYSMNQGYKGWYYGSENGNSFRASVWKPELNAWQGDETYSLIWDNGFHPGSLSKAVRRWVAPSDGQILISGRVIDQNSTCGDGIILSITKDKSLLYSVSIANGNTSEIDINLTTTIVGGNTISFELDSKGDNSCDGTIFDPKIVLTTTEFCVDCLKIRVGRPLYVRGPEGGGLDGPISVEKLANGQFRGFGGANLPFPAYSYHVDALDPWSITGPKTVSLQAGNGSDDRYDHCGVWITDIEKINNYWFGLVHAETSCHYELNGSTHKSMLAAISLDQGASFTDYGQIITGQDSPVEGLVTGIGDCQMVRWMDDYLYAYCLRASDSKGILARAPVSNPFPGSWKFWSNGGWDQAGLGGQAGSLIFNGGPAAALYNASKYIPYHAVAAVGNVKYSTQTPEWAVSLAFSRNMVLFDYVKEPIMLQDHGRWTEAASPSELLAYQSMVGLHGGDAWAGEFLLYYMYIPPQLYGNSQYLITRNVAVTPSGSIQTPQVGVELSNWYRAETHERWATTAAPVRGGLSGSSFEYQGSLGYLMTKPPEGFLVSRLEECQSIVFEGGTSYRYFHRIVPEGTCSSSDRLRTLGWVYQSAQSNTRPLYSCFDSVWLREFVSNLENCEEQGSKQSLLGYTMDQ